MKILLNGETNSTAAGTVQALLDELRITPGKVAVEVNLKVVKKCDYDSTPLHEGDSVEIVNFVGGG